ncbi:hypothetical protein ACIP93_17425 [Streptomyces sp. NPDC088745]|uniref:hypothetical protein n=1 Tax=Streptomyces sp. NPDC088745 TaxID=3365884 RepID=UPI003821A824
MVESVKRYFSAEQTVGQLKFSCWVFVVFAVLELFGFVTTLMERQPSTWTLLWTGVGTVFFPAMLLLARREMRKKRQATEDA